MLVLEIILFVILGLCVLGLAFVVVLMVKNDITCSHHMLICDAIHNYHISLIKSGYFGRYEVDYDDMESYDQTMWRLWDWGYTRILPKEKFEIIKPYLGKEVK